MDTEVIIMLFAAAVALSTLLVILEKAKHKGKPLMLKFLITTAVLIVSTLSAKADGNKLLSDCTSSELISWGVCIGFVGGVADAATHANEACMPSGVTRGQTRDIVVKYLQDNPKYRHYHEFFITQAALMIAFPCSKKASN